MLLVIEVYRLDARDWLMVLLYDSGSDGGSQNHQYIGAATTL